MPRRLYGLAPVVAGLLLVGEDLIEGVGLFDQDVALLDGLVQQDGLQTDKLQHRQEHANEGTLGVGVMEQAAEADGLVLHDEAALDVVDHLGDRDGLFIDIEYGTLTDTLEDVLEDADEVYGVGCDLALSVGGILELAHARVGPGGLFDLLLLEEHLGGCLETLVLEEAFYELAAGVFGVACEHVGRVAGEQRLRLDVDQQRGHVDELAGGVDVGLLELVGVVKKLRRDAGDGDVVDVDVLLANKVEQKVERAVVDLAYSDREGGLGGFFLLFVFA